jgi:hypothetical protein
MHLGGHFSTGAARVTRIEFYSWNGDSFFEKSQAVTTRFWWRRHLASGFSLQHKAKPPARRRRHQNHPLLKFDFANNESP